MEFIRRDTDYGIRGLAAMAKRPGLTAGVADISNEIGVSKDFLYKIFRKLRTAGLLTARRGVKGGFTLSKEPKEMNLLEVIETLQGPVHMNKCFRKQDSCPHRKTCPIRPALGILQEQIAETLLHMRLSDVT